MPLGRFSNKHLELVYTKYEVNRSIIKDGRCIQPFNPVFSTLTADQRCTYMDTGVRAPHCAHMSIMIILLCKQKSTGRHLDFLWFWR